jgi:hypothetical protein
MQIHRSNAASIAYYLPRRFKIRIIQFFKKPAINNDYFCVSRYHAMDCLSLLEHSSGNKSLHIANATQLFSFTQMYNQYYWSIISLVQILYTPIKFPLEYLPNLIYHKSSTQKQLFAHEGDLHLCQSAAEFLLEPWLLMQLPWHPAVYYQWLTAALAEALKARKQLAEFFWWPVPKRLTSAVNKMLLLVESLHHRLNCGFRLINWLANFNKDSDSGHEINCQTVECILNLVILPSLPTIEFLVGDQFNILTRALKRMAWPVGGNLTEEEVLVGQYAKRKEDGGLPMFEIRSADNKISGMFGKIGSFEDIKNELAILPRKITYFTMEQLMTALVSIVIYFDQQLLLSFVMFLITTYNGLDWNF